MADTQLTASAGLAPTSTLAKIASNVNKPNGQHTLRLYTRQDVMQFMHGLTCRQVPGIGKSQEHILRGLGIHTVGDIYMQRYILYHLITPKTFHFLLSAALGVGGMFRDAREESGGGNYNNDGDRSNADRDGGNDGEGSGWQRKSIGHERTFPQLQSAPELLEIAHRILTEVSQDMRERELFAGQMVIKLKLVNFQVKQYSRTISPPTDKDVILQQALDALVAPLASTFRDYRLLGVRLCALVSRGQAEAAARAAVTAAAHRRQQPTLESFLCRHTPTAVAKVSGGGNRICAEKERGALKKARSPRQSFSISDSSDEEAESALDVIVLEESGKGGEVDRQIEEKVDEVTDDDGVIVIE